MELKSITDDSITATSMEGNTFQPSSARLHLNIASGGWCAKKSLHDVPQYLQVDLDRSWALIAVATQGIESIQSWVSEYYLSTTFDHKVWIFVHDFTGKKVRNYFNIERFQRIVPKKFISETQLALFYRTYFLKKNGSCILKGASTDISLLDQHLTIQILIISPSCNGRRDAQFTTLTQRSQSMSLIELGVPVLIVEQELTSRPKIPTIDPINDNPLNSSCDH